MQHVSDIEGWAASLMRRGAVTALLFHRQAARDRRTKTLVVDVSKEVRMGVI